MRPFRHSDPHRAGRGCGAGGHLGPERRSRGAARRAWSGGLRAVLLLHHHEDDLQGRRIFAVGGNAEAARQAGINVQRVRVIVFMISSTMAAISGIMAASRLLAVNQSSGASDFLPLAIAAPVIAGTSLFGGRGSVWHALLGALVIQSISNGMDLLGLSSSVQVPCQCGARRGDGRRDRAPAEAGGGTHIGGRRSGSSRSSGRGLAQPSLAVMSNGPLGSPG